jgi:hypothetical protein
MKLNDPDFEKLESHAHGPTSILSLNQKSSLSEL